MSEFIIFLTKNDFTNLSEFILKTYDATFIPSVSYKKPESEKLRSIQEIEKHLTEYSHAKAPELTYHITSPLWTIEPIYFDFVKNKFVGSHYSIRATLWGPSIDFTPRMYGLPSSFRNKIIGGTIGDYPYYISGSFLKTKSTDTKPLVDQNA